MLRRSLVLSTAAGLAIAGLFAASPAKAEPDYRVIRWSLTGVCQIYDFGFGGRPIPSDYRTLTPPLPSFTAALRAKDALARRGACTI
jgi:hypothetical protein